jgi:GT2 family glycosyltransferase
MKQIAIVIVTYNSATEIGACLDSLRNLPGAEVVVVDNASWDATCDEATRRGARVIQNATNVGFAAAVNIGILATTAPLVLLLNPDARLIGGLEALAAHFDDPQTGAAGGMLVGPDGKPQAGFMARNLPAARTLILEVLGINRLWPANPVNWHYRCRGLDPMTASIVEQPAGAFLMFPRAVWQKLGGFDERFRPIWFEDVDFCARIKAAGLHAWYEPVARASHTGGHSITPLSTEAREKYWYGSLLEYGAKHYRPTAFRALCLAVMLGVGLRALWGFMRGGAALRGYGRVAVLALSWFFRVRTNSGVGVV